MAESLVREVDAKQDKDLGNKIEQVLSQVKQLEILIPDIDDVQNYLIHYSDIIDLIIPVCMLVKEKFKYPAQVSLEVYHDLEIIDEYISIEIRQKNYDRSVMERIEKIEAQFENELVGKDGWIIVTTDFQQPR